MEKEITLSNKELFTIPILPTLTEIGKLDIRVEWAVDKLIPENAITLLHGKGGIGKTWLCLELGRCVANSEEFFGLRTKGVPVYYIDFENSLPSLSERARILGESLMYIWHLSTNPPPPKLDDVTWEAYKALDPGLIIFDTLRSCQSSEENSSTEMANVIGRLKELRAKGFTIILMHHTTKNGENFRGSQAILDLCDHCLSLERVKKIGSDEPVEDNDLNLPLKLAIKDKTRFAPDFKPMYFKFGEAGCLELADNPDSQLLEKILKLIQEQVEKGERTNQARLFEAAIQELGIKGKETFLNLLKKGTGKLWESKPTGKGNEKIYYPLSME